MDRKNVRNGINVNFEIKGATSQYLMYWYTTILATLPQTTSMDYCRHLTMSENHERSVKINSRVEAC